MEKILLFYGSYGGGHLSAAKSLNEYIIKNYPNVKTELVDCIKYINQVVNRLTTTAYSEMAKKAPWAWKKIYYTSEKGLFSKVSNFSNKLMSFKLYKCIQDFKPDLIISTHPFSSQMCSILKKKGKINCKVATVLTDFHIHNQWLVGSDEMDYYFVSNAQMKEDMCKKGIDSFKIFVTGIPFSERFLGKFDSLDTFKNLHLDSNLFTVLFFAGGKFGLGRTKTFEIFKTLISDFPDLQVIAISGKNEKMKTMFTDCVTNLHKENTVCVLDYSNHIPELMSIVDFVITKPGGLTATESLVSGLPMLIINPIPGQEEQNAAFLEQSGVAIWLKKNDNIHDTLAKLLTSPDTLKTMKTKAKELSKPNAVFDICHILFDI